MLCMKVIADRKEINCIVSKGAVFPWTRLHDTSFENYSDTVKAFQDLVLATNSKGFKGRKLFP